MRVTYFINQSLGGFMTQNEFIAKCEQLSVAPELALENDLIISALQSKNDALVIALLLTQF